MNLTITIMAGGSSRRMGQDKALLRVNSQSTLLERITHEAIVTGYPVSVIGRLQPENWPFHDIGFVEDLHPGCGPLGGIETALDSCWSNILAIACDMPLVTKREFLWLIDCARSIADLQCGVVVRNGLIHEPLFSIYTIASLSLVRSQIGSGDWALHRMIEKGQFHQIQPPAEIAETLKNINTPADCKRFL